MDTVSQLLGLDSWVLIVSGVVLGFVGVLVWNWLKGGDDKPPTGSGSGGGKMEQKKPKITEDVKKPEGDVVKIFWGSQTGTAEDFSETISDEAKERGINCEMIDLEEYDVDHMCDEKYVIFVAATYGEGEPTDNAKEFYDWLMEDDKEEGLFRNTKFSVFALGNKTYENYNETGRKIDSRMEELGGQRFYDRGEGDDDSNLEEEFMKWKEGLWGPLCSALNIAMQDQGDESRKEIKRKCRLDTVDKKPVQYALGTDEKGRSYDLRNPYIAPVVENKELHGEDSDRSCLHVELDIGSNLTYEPGDHLGVYPRNERVLVDALLDRLKVPAERRKEVVQLISLKDNKVILGPVRVEDAFNYLDITNPPRKSVILGLAQYCSDDNEKERLYVLASSDDSSLPKDEQYGTWIKHDRRNISDILEACPSLAPPMDHLLELLPIIPVRYYSISSSLNASPGRVSLTSVVVQYKTPMGRLHNGVCSNYFVEMEPGKATSVLPVYVRSSNFKLPTDTTVPIIMVGPGTGLAPFRGFLQQRQFLQEKGTELGEAVLFFGCRNRDHDYLYKKELSSFVENGVLSKLICAFSREGPSKVYVQDKLAEEETKEYIWKLIDSGAYIYICGDALHMAPDVRNAFINIVKEQKGITQDEATRFITKLTSEGRYLSDTWF